MSAVYIPLTEAEGTPLKDALKCLRLLERKLVHELHANSGDEDRHDMQDAVALFQLMVSATCMSSYAIHQGLIGSYPPRFNREPY